MLATAGSVEALAGQIDLMVEQANVYFSNSQIRATVNLVHEEEVSFMETGDMYQDILQIVDRHDGILDEVHRLRDRYGADIVCLLEGKSNAGGISELIYRASPGYEPFGFIICNYELSLTGYVFPHELGYDLGAKHGRNHRGVPDHVELIGGGPGRNECAASDSRGSSVEFRDLGQSRRGGCHPRLKPGHWRNVVG